MCDRLNAETRATLLAGHGAQVALRRNRSKPAWTAEELHKMISCKLDEEARERLVDAINAWNRRTEVPR